MNYFHMDHDDTQLTLDMGSNLHREVCPSGVKLTVLTVGGDRLILVEGMAGAGATAFYSGESPEDSAHEHIASAKRLGTH